MTLASSGSVRIQVCGPLAIERDGERLDARLPGRQGRLLFTYLVVNRHRHVARDEVAEALWREPDPAAVDARLNPLLSKLRRVFGTDAIDGRSTLRLCLREAWVDLEAAVEAIHRAESAVAQQDWTRAWGPALTALFVSERAFLPGEDAPWIEEVRRQLTELRLRALECHAAATLGIGAENPAQLGQQRVEPGVDRGRIRFPPERFGHRTPGNMTVTVDHQVGKEQPPLAAGQAGIQPLAVTLDGERPADLDPHQARGRQGHANILALP